MENTNREKFGSKLGVIAAAAGSAVGLGNIYRFPIVAGNNGGGAFLLIYLLILLFLGVSLVVAEFIIGRRAAKNAVGSFKKLAPKTAWPIVGFAGVITAFAIITFYSTVWSGRRCRACIPWHRTGSVPSGTVRIPTWRYAMRSRCSSCRSQPWPGDASSWDG